MAKDSNIERVVAFHRAFGMSLRDTPGWPIDDIKVFGQIAALGEETNELLRAVLAHDLVAVFDALVDLRYVLDGTVLKFGLQGHFEAGCIEVHASNMTKLFPAAGPVFGPSGKILKGPNYRSPDLARILDGAGQAEVA